MVEFCAWIDAMPVWLFNLFVVSIAASVWIFTPVLERISYGFTAASRLERRLDSGRDSLVCSVLCEPVFVRLDADAVDQLVSSSIHGEPRTPVCREPVSSRGL